MCTTFFLLSTLALLCRHLCANRVEPEPSSVDGEVVSTGLDPDHQASGREKEPLK
ncbi:PREDICTED: progressive rod-cone degeneration protein [Chrysochloris asiatica]|uniref:Progressive rod-cone degeneration protein n=1 Tax=Chrysochloris asiatica TaxID=185453 RepID=A0A9B0WTK9_CHRAS|nr:PREDICTED: progressive rod-cone degeneration protein [Chrysochloris asiatica]